MTTPKYKKDLTSLSKKIDSLQEELQQLEAQKQNLLREEALKANASVETEVVELAGKIDALCAPLSGDFRPSEAYMSAIRTIKEVVSNQLQWVDSGCSNWNDSGCSTHY